MARKKQLIVSSILDISIHEKKLHVSMVWTSEITKKKLPQLENLVVVDEKNIR